ncbi:MAG: GIY-YIG nuclease family protein, partial [Holophagaceae bacterium]
MTSPGVWSVYLLRCGDGTLYCGIALDVAARLAQHQEGKGAKYTRGRGPLELVFAEPCASRPEALRRERQPAEYRKALTTIVTNTQQMTFAIETLVAAAQQESGLARGRCDAGDVLDEVADTCSALAERRGLQIEAETPSPPIALGVEAEIAVRVLQ